MEAEIRAAGVDDITKIQQVARTTWHHAYRESIPERVREEFVSWAYSADSLQRRIGSNVFVVALQDGNVVGFANFRPLSQTEVELAAIYVLPEMQTQGIGGRLLAAGIAHFAAETSFVLRVQRDNLPAQRFYEARGFRRAGEYTEEHFGHDFHEGEMLLNSGS